MPYAHRMAVANALLGQPRALVFQGREGEPELAPARSAPIVFQEGEALGRVRMPGPAREPYPRTPQPREALLAELARWREGRFTDEEAQAVARMVAALRWMAGGPRPEGWTVEPWKADASSS